MLKKPNILLVTEVGMPKNSLNGDTTQREITMFDVTNRKWCKTFVCSRYRNSRQWQDIIDNYFKHDKATILCGDWQYKADSVEVIDADGIRSIKKSDSQSYATCTMVDADEILAGML